MSRYPDIPVNSGLIRMELRKMMNDLADTIATGGVADWTEYQKLVGKMEGLAIAERLLMDETEKIQTQEEA